MPDVLARGRDAAPRAVGLDRVAREHLAAVLAQGVRAMVRRGVLAPSDCAMLDALLEKGDVPPRPNEPLVRETLRSDFAGSTPPAMHFTRHVPRPSYAGW